MTLLELLAVTALMSTVAMLGVGALGRATHKDPMLVAVDSLQHFDRRERRLSRDGDTPVGKWVVQYGGARWQADAKTGTSASSKGALSMPSGIRVDWYTHDDVALTELQYRDGWGPDFRVVLDDGQLIRRYRVYGLSGQWVEED